MSNQIKFTIGKSGDVKISDICGAPGRECLNITKDYERILGEVRESTREFTEDVDDMEQTSCQENG